MKSLNLLCVAIMVKNEAERIERTLSTVIEYIDHVVVLDTGSTDKTKEIITNYCQTARKPLKMEDLSFVNFAHNRNHLLKMCHGLSDFVLLLDANEEARQMDMLRKFLVTKRTCRKVSGFKCRYYLTNDNGVDGNDKIFYKIGLIRNNIPEIYYEYPVHECLTCSVPDKFTVTDELSDEAFYIYQDKLRDKSSASRYLRDIEMLEEDLKDRDKDLPRVYRYLIESNKHIGNIEEVFKYCDIQIKMHESEYLVDYIYYDEYYHALLSIGCAYAEIGNDDFYKWFLKAYKHCKMLYDNPEAMLLIGEAYFKRNDMQLSYQYIKKACAIEEPVLVPKQVMYNPTLYRRLRWKAMCEIAYKINKLDDYYRALEKLG